MAFGGISTSQSPASAGNRPDPYRFPMWLQITMASVCSPCPGALRRS